MPHKNRVSTSVFSAVAFVLLSAQLYGQGWAVDGRLSLPMDWSFGHVVYTRGFSAQQAAKMKNDPRLYYLWALQGHLPELAKATAAAEEESALLKRRRPELPEHQPPERDWSLSLGSAGVAQNMSPAKFNFNINETLSASSCTGTTADFVVYGLNVVGGSLQANILAVDNLYAGTSPTGLCGTVPTVMWAYNASTASGSITTSPVLSLDGTKVAFVESVSGKSILHVLKWTTGGTVTSPGTLTTTSAPSAATCTAPCMVSLTYDSAHATTLSSPFYDYSGTDTLYVGNDDGQLFKITGVFSGTPAVTGWSTDPATIATGSSIKMTAPVLDGAGNILIGGSDGNLYSVAESTGVKQATLAVGSGGADGGGIVDAPVVDGTNGTVFVSAAANAANVGAATANTTAVTVQAATSNLGSPQVATIGQGSKNTTANLNIVGGSFDNSYDTWTSGTNSGNFYVIGTAPAGTSPTLYQIPFSGVGSISLSTNGSGYTTPVVVISGGSGTGATATASGGVTSVIVTFPGSGDTAVPTVSYDAAPAGGTTASGSTVNVGVDTIGVTNGGSGYTSVPSVTFTGTGSGASATAALGVKSITLTNGGSCSSGGANKAITFSPADSATGWTATASSSFPHPITSIQTGNAGSGFTSVPSLTVSGCSGFTLTPVLEVVSVGNISPGSYTTMPNAVISGATLSTTIQVVNVSNPTTPGSGYTSAPGVNFNSGTADAISEMNITQVVVNYGGGGYPSPGTSVTITGGTIPAIATANINAGSVMTPGTPLTTSSVSGTSAVQASPISEIFNNSVDYLFYGYGFASSTGEIASQIVTNGPSTVTAVAEPHATGGTSGIVVDNISNQNQASSIYFSTLASAQDSFTISTATRSGTTATITTSTNHDFSPGESVTITGSTSPFDGTFTVASVTSSTVFTIAVANSGSASRTGGTVVSTSSVFHAVKLTQSVLH